MVEMGRGPALIAARSAVAADVVQAVPPAPGLVLMGFAARESDGTPAVATFRIMHGPTVGDGVMLLPIELTGNQSTSDWFGPDGIETPRGLTIDWIAGTVDITLFYRVNPADYRLN